MKSLVIIQKNSTNKEDLLLSLLMNSLTRILSIAEQKYEYHETHQHHEWVTYRPYIAGMMDEIQEMVAELQPNIVSWAWFPEV